MIVATAGHIDHGKTLLVKRLTGVDTDRLPEERARGISIDLGFAYLPLAGGGLIGFVDVPGHERFVRNMLAGVSGIDFALLVVAADDGIMPQTREHLQILSLLRVERGAAVITKADRVDAARVQAVENEVRQLLAESSLAGAPVLAVSALSGAGMPALQELLLREAQASRAREDEGRHFRFAVDRAFTVAGSGTVVTGTVFAGALEVGDSVVISPAGEEARVRGMQIHGATARRVTAGQRCAINLARTKLGAVQRGDWIVAPGLHVPTSRIDVRLQVLPSEAQALKHWTPVHVHLATCDVTARVAIRGGAAIAPGSDAIVQLVLDQPIGALRGDRLILRDQAAMRTIGGGMVLDPFAPARRRPVPERARELGALEHQDPAAALAAWTLDGHAIDPDRFAVAYNLAPARLAALLDGGALAVLGKGARNAIPRARHDSLCQALLDALADFHRQQPDADGKSTDALRAALAPDLGRDAWTALVQALADGRKLEVRGDKLALAGHAAPDAEDPLWQRIGPAIAAAGYLAPSVEDLALQLSLKQAVVRDVLFKRMRHGDLMRVTPDRFWLRARLADLAAAAQAIAEAQPERRFTAAQFRDATGVGRNHAIELLEYFDRLGISRRIGDARILLKDYVPILGAGKPPARPAAPARNVAQAAKQPSGGAARPPQRKTYGVRR